jgi:hypothetical protein
MTCEEREDRAKYDETTMAYLINLVDQVRGLSKILRDAGIHVPAKIGTLGPAPRDVQAWYWREYADRFKDPI